MGLKKNIFEDPVEPVRCKNSETDDEPIDGNTSSVRSTNEIGNISSRPPRVQFAEALNRKIPISPPPLAHESPQSCLSDSPPLSPGSSPPHHLHRIRDGQGVGTTDDIPMITLSRHNEPRAVSPFDDPADEEDEGITIGASKTSRAASENSNLHQAKRLVQTFKDGAILPDGPGETSGGSGRASPIEIYDDELGYVRTHKKYRPGILRLLMSLSRHPSELQKTPLGSPRSSMSASGTSTPRKCFSKSPKDSQTSMAHLLESSSMLASAATSNISTRPERPALPRSRSSGILTTLQKVTGRLPIDQHESKITIRVDDIQERQKYIIKLCRALMENGAPTHRLEEMMKTTANYLELSAQFMYLPGCMVVSFDDHELQQSTIRLVKANQGSDLGKLEDIHDLFKEVNYGRLGFKDAAERLENIRQAKPRYSSWFLVLMYGFASATVGPFAFQARLIDLPISFILGCMLGFLALIAAPKTEVYSNVFEVVAAIVTSASARAVGSIRHNGAEVFCFSAIAQSSIALILPGYTILCGSLELQAHNIVTGSVRIVYAIITSLLLGFGITCVSESSQPFDSPTICAATTPLLRKMLH